MTHATQSAAAQAAQAFTGQYLPLEQVTKPNLTTAEAAYYLDRSSHTLQVWACRSGTGPLAPKRVGGRLAWNTNQVKALAGVSA